MNEFYSSRRITMPPIRTIELYPFRWLRKALTDGEFGCENNWKQLDTGHFGAAAL